MNIVKLLRIDLIKLTNYRAFNILLGLYAFLIVGVPVGVIEFLKWLKRVGAEFDGFDPMKIPVLHFPDIWQNVTWVYSFPIVKIFLAIVIVISVSNEFSYKTIRQNIIDGLSRQDFILSKIATITLLALSSTVLVYFTCLVSALIYSPEIDFEDIMYGTQFIVAYFIDLEAFLLMTFLFTIVFKRSALTIFMLLIYRPIEQIIIALLPRELDFLDEYFPMEAMAQLIEVPFPRYVFQEIQDYVTLDAVAIVLVYIALFIWTIFTKLKNSDL